MVKKLILVFALCLFVEGFAVIRITAGFERPPKLSPLTEEQPPLPPTPMDLPESMTLLNDEDQFSIPAKDLDALSAKEVWRRAEQNDLSGYLFEALGGKSDGWRKDIAVNEQGLADVILAQEKRINRSVQNAELVIDDFRAVNFKPHLPGQTLDLQATRSMLLTALLNANTKLNLPVVKMHPTTKLGDLNSQGIKELLVRGQTDFSGSSASRIQNVTVGASQYRGLIIPRGAEFSFNDNLGVIDAAHGYRPELVIKPEGTVPEFGGGLCQVSSTAFRAAFFGGLPITQRRNHSYAVAYYEWIADDLPRSAGLDATIYPGAQDLKFVNDTPGDILIWTAIEGKHLYFDFYGTKDGRKVAVEGPEIYDRRSSGALKAKVTRTLTTASGEIQELVLNSSYVSPNLFPRVFEYPPPPTPPAEVPAETTPVTTN